MKTSEAILIYLLAILEVSMEGVLLPWGKLGLADTCSIDEFGKLFPILDAALGETRCD